VEGTVVAEETQSSRGLEEPLPVTVDNWPSGSAQDGTDITSPTPAMPAGGVGIRGWLSAIWTKLNGTIGGTGSFWPTTQPVSGTFWPTPYNFIQSAETVTYKYYGFVCTGGWQIKRKTLATGVWEVAADVGDYATAWAARADKDYGYI
jgi:hypothetical protein